MQYEFSIEFPSLAYLQPHNYEGGDNGNINEFL